MVRCHATSSERRVARYPAVLEPVLTTPAARGQDAVLQYEGRSGDEEPRMTDWRAADLVRLTAGVLDLTAPAAVASTELGHAPRAGDLVVFRVLGARQVLQAWATAVTGWGALGAVVDLAHLTSMVPVALLSRRWRRAALLQIAVAGVLLVIGVRRR
jgi:hypothetical protein